MARFDANGNPLSGPGNPLFFVYLGGAKSAEATGIALYTNAASKAILDITGITYSDNAGDGFLTPGTLQPYRGNGDAFVASLDPSKGGKPLLFVTYVGGTATDQGQGIAVDTAGNAYATGYTKSPDFRPSSRRSCPVSSRTSPGPRTLMR